MTIAEFEQRIFDLFGEDVLTRLPAEWGLTLLGGEDIRRLGYAVNLTPDTVIQAAGQEVDLLLTHHDAWPFLYGMKEECLGLLSEATMSHFFMHAPLDAADFGTSAMLAARLDARIIEKTHPHDGLLVGRLCEFDHPQGFDELQEKIAQGLGEPVRGWKNHEWPIRTIDITTGGGMMTDDVNEAVDHEADAYLTGEKVLYTVQYAAYTGIDLFVGSHIGTEIFGMAGLAGKISEAYPDLEVIQIPEERLE